MSDRFDVIVVGAGLGGLTAAAMLARAGRKVLVIERNNSVGGAASTYKSGDLIVEASLHATSDPRDPRDPKHKILSDIGVLDAVEWVPVGSLYEVRGGPVGAPFLLPDNFAAARTALTDRFPHARESLAALLREMEDIATGLGALGRGRGSIRHRGEGLGALLKLAPALRDWRRTLAEKFDAAFGGDEAVKCALAANMAYYHDNPAELWWLFFAMAQGGYLASGARYIKGGSQRLSNALARAVKQAGGELRLRRTVTQIDIDAQGRPRSVAHVGRDGVSEENSAAVVVANIAPGILSEILPAGTRARFDEAYAKQRLSISLFAATFGLSIPPSELGLRHYSNILLPSWMTRLGDFPLNAELLAGPPGERMPLLTVVDYSAIDSGLAGPPYPVSVVGLDRLANWTMPDKPALDARRESWRQALLAAIDREFPGFSAHVVGSVFNTARSIRNYLNAPEGAVYGFAPLPPHGPLFGGVDRSPKTPIPGLYLASSYAGAGGFTGAIWGGAAAAECVLGS